MKRGAKVTLICTWQLLATLVLTFIWGNNPHLFFRPPASFSNWLANLYGVTNAEELGDLELLYVFTSSFVLILIITSIVMVGAKMLTRASSRRAKTRG